VHFCLQPYTLITLILPLHIIFSYSCWVPTISVLILAIFPCYSNLLLRRKRCTGILQWGVLGYVLPRLPFLWSYGVLRCSISLRVIIVFRYIIYVIIIPYSWHLVICDYFWLYVRNNWSWVMHTISTWFWHKNRVWHSVLRESGEVPPLAVALSPSSPSQLTETQVNAAAINGVQWGAWLALTTVLSHFLKLEVELDLLVSKYNTNLMSDEMEVL
jgi:hypothetical protein